MNSITPPASVLGFHAHRIRALPASEDLPMSPISGCPSRMAPEIGGEAPAEATAAATQVTNNTRPSTYEALLSRKAARSQRPMWTRAALQTN